MKDPSQKIQDALVNALADNITYSSTTIPVYSVVPQNNGSKNYILINDNFLVSDGTKDSFINDGYTNIYIVSEWNTNSGSKKAMNSISSSVTETLLPTTSSVLDLAPEFSCILMYNEQTLDDLSLIKTEKIARKIIRLHLQIQQLN